MKIPRRRSIHVYTFADTVTPAMPNYRGNDEMTIDIAIPTLNRRDKLMACVSSIEMAYLPGVQVYVLPSSQEEVDMYADLYRRKGWVKVEQTDYSKVSTCWNNFVRDSVADAVLFLCDDTTLDSDCLLNASACLRSHYPDLDGVVGLNVTNYPPTWPEAITQYGFRLVGNKFHERFPKGQAYCPEYYRFYVDTEMGEFAKAVGKFTFCQSATMQHWHPDSPGSGKADSTHYANRGEKQKWDNEIWAERQRRGYLWGKSFKTVGIR